MFINSRFCLENAGEEEKRQFLQEIDLMKDVGSHRNILSILGFWIRSEPIMLIMEYVPHGDLLQWLRNKRQQIKHVTAVSYTHLRAHETDSYLVCRLLLEKKNHEL